MPATSKAELVQATEREFAKLEKLIVGIQGDEAAAKDDDDISIKDVIAHRAHWIDLFFGWYEDGKAGKEVFFPAKGYKWNELKRYNAHLREKQSRLGWAKACHALRAAHDRLAVFIANSSDDELYGGPMKGAKNDWTPGRWAEAAGPSHYRSAAKYIASRRKTLRA